MELSTEARSKLIQILSDLNRRISATEVTDEGGNFEEYEDASLEIDELSNLLTGDAGE